MPLDHFKTQVLLLHSEQSTLDSLSSGFDERYTVHCATSGSEALTTLGETPINVIISAQKLPGMSGAEALREAKKRSPETIGILLAGDSDRGLEALVGEKEVFQIVRGDVNGDSLKKLVDNATQRMRLMALAESANDMAANVDEPAEHIIMETSENGATIISDGTGRMPALNPDKVSAAVAVGSQSVGVLVLTKDQDFLTTIKESSRGMHTVHYANTLKQADETIRKHKVGVAVVDAAMVGEKIEQLTQHLRKGSPRIVSIVAGRRDDGEMLMDLINRGKVYRFLLKPVSPGRARLAVEASVKHHLEAPDAAFKTKGSAPGVQTSARPAPKPAPKAEATTRPAPAPKTGVAAIPKANSAVAATTSKAARRPGPVDPPLGETKSNTPIDEGLSSAFDDNDSGFIETVAGLLRVFGKKGGRKEKATPMSIAKPLPHAEPAARSGGSGRSLVKKITIPAVVIGGILIAGGLYWFLNGSEENRVSGMEQSGATDSSVTEADVDFDSVGSSGVDIQELVDESRRALDAGQVFNPAGSNAIELYMAAIEADPSNTVLAEELDAVIDEALGMAETALLESRLDDASAALKRVALADAENPRLPFLTAQLSQMQLRGYLADARAAIRDTRFEDAGNALAAARALDVADVAEIAAVAQELSAARSEQRVDEVLALATARLEEGDLLSPANDNARYYYELVLSNDPANTAARQGLSIIASKIVLQARSEIDAGNLETAEVLLTDARAIDASSSELDATAAALASARDAVIARQERAAEARRIAAAEREAAEERAAAERRIAEEKAAEAKAEEERATPETQPAEDSVAEAAESEAVEDADNATLETENAAADPGNLASEPGQATADARDITPVPISSLIRTRYVAPKYPRSAQRRNQSGWVDIVFTVAMDGSVKDLEVRQSEPEGVFDNAALRAVEKWEFDPVFQNGVIVEKRAGVRMMFALE